MRWAKLQLNKEGVIIGDPEALSRLVSFGRKLASWYAVAAVVFVLLVASAGALFLAQKGSVEGWLAPWLLAVLFQGMLLWTVPFQALFEGCNQVVAIQRFQLWQGILANVVLWICLAAGAGLWSVAALIGVQAAITMYYLGVAPALVFLAVLAPTYRFTNRLEDGSLADAMAACRARRGELFRVFLVHAYDFLLPRRRGGWSVWHDLAGFYYVAGLRSGLGPGTGASLRNADCPA